jgi:hypothetical protein
MQLKLAPHPSYPITCSVCTILMLASFVAVVIPFSKTDSLAMFVASLAATAVLIPASRGTAHAIGSRIMTKKAKAGPQNLRKFCDQAWQLVIHVGMTAFEVYLLARPGLDGKWWYEPNIEGSTWEPVDQSEDFLLNTFYVVQVSGVLGIDGSALDPSMPDSLLYTRTLSRVTRRRPIARCGADGCPQWRRPPPLCPPAVIGMRTSGGICINRSPPSPLPPPPPPPPQLLDTSPQLAIWFYTAFAHRFLDARHKDYLAMFR